MEDCHDCYRLEAVVEKLMARIRALEAKRGTGEFAGWRVNDDGSVSPPGRPEAWVYRLSNGDWGYRIADDFDGRDFTFPTFPDAVRELLKALEAHE